jgi:hypothetical protein
MMKYILALCFIFICKASATELDPKLCRDVDPTTRFLVPQVLAGWLKYPHAIELCPLYAPQGSLVWWLATIRYDLVDDKALDDPTIHQVSPDGLHISQDPCSRIMDSVGRQIGRISESFPTDAPGKTRVFLRDWRNNFPRHIDIRVTGAAVEGDYDGLSMDWNAATRSYEHRGAWQTFCDTR